MAVSGLNLTGNVSLNAEPAIKAAQTLGARLRTLSENSRTSSKTLVETAAAMDKTTAAAVKERASLASLATAQARINALQKESAANIALTNAKASAVTSGAANASGIAATKKQIMLGESMEKITNANIIAQQRLNNEELRGSEIQARTTNAAQVAAGRTALTQARAMTEAVRQRIAIEQQEGRVALNNARVQESATRQQVATQRLAMQQQAAASAAMARAANQQRESLAVTRGALGSVGASMTHFGVIGAGVFIGMAANAVIMQRQFANVVRTSNILDSKLSETGKNKAIDSLRLQFDALAQQLPISYKELTEIGTAANQLGVSHENIASFTKTVAQFAATTGVSVDTASTAFGRLDSLIVDVNRHGKMVGGVNHDYQNLADSINKVGVRSVATDQQIINVASQISGIANAAGLGYKEIVGFSGALASVNISPYLARGMTTRLFTNITNAVSDGGDELQKFATVSGMSAKDFSNAWRTDPQKAITYLFDGIRASGGDAVNVLKELGINSVLDQPALVRLANAADSAGNSASAAARKGGILRQTFNDAATAAGENAKQYAKISGTVQAHLQVALNRVQVLFRNIGESNLGPLGAMIDGISSSALKLSQNLDKPFKLLGALPTGLKNSDVIGFGVDVLGVTAALALLGGATAKVGSGLIALRQAYLGIRTFMGGGGVFKTTATSAVEATAAIDGETVAVRKLTAAQREAVAASRAETATRAGAALVTNKVTPENSAIAASVTPLQRMTAIAKESILSSNNAIVKSMVSVGSRGAAAMRTVGGAFKTAAGGAATLGRAVGSVAFSLPGLAIGAVVSGMLALDHAMRQVGTDAGSMSVSLVKANSALDILKSTTVSGATDGIAAMWDKSTKSFMTSTASFKASLAGLGTGGVLDDFVAKFNSVFTEGALNKGFNYTTEGLDKIDNGLKKLSDGGNADGAVKAIQTLFKGMNDTEITNALAHMGNATSILTSKLNEQGKVAGKNNENVIKLAHNNTVLGLAQSKAATAADLLSGAMGKNTEGMNAYLDSVKTSASAALDLNKAFSTASKGSKPASFGAFITQSKKQYQDFVDFQRNALLVVKGTGESLADVSALDPHILSGAIKSGKKGMAELKKAMDMKEAMTAFETSIAQIGGDPNGKLLDAFASLGTGAQKKIADALANGSSIPDAFRAAGQQGVDAFNKTVGKGSKIKLQVDKSSIEKDLANLTTGQAKTLSIKIMGDAAPAIAAGESAADVIRQMKVDIGLDVNSVLALRHGETTAQQISRLKSTLNIYGDSSRAQKAGESTAAYIGRLEGKIIVDADPNRAHETAASLESQINKMVTTFAIHGDPLPAQKAGESAAAYIVRLRASMVVDANAVLAKTKGMDAAQQISVLKPLMQILGDPAPAQQQGESAAAYVNRLKAIIQVIAGVSPAEAQAAAAAKEISRLRSQIKVSGNTAPAQHDGESAAAYINRLKGKIKIDGDKTLAQGKADAVSHYVTSKHPIMLINGNPNPAYAKADSAKHHAQGLIGTMKIDGNNMLAIGKGRGAARAINGMRGTMTADARTGVAESALNYAARNRTATITAHFDGGGGGFATGGLIRGPGSGTSDSILANVSNGEYVVRASAVKRYKHLLDQINYGRLPGYATGGHVTGGSAKYEGTAAAFTTAANRIAAASVSHITELSPYDRHLLRAIADNIGISIQPDYLASATTGVNRSQARRGNG